MNIRRPSDVLGSQIVTLLDPKPFLDALESRKSVFQCAYLAEYDRYVEEQVLYDQSYRMLFCMLEDVSDEAAERERKRKCGARPLKLRTRWWRSRCVSFRILHPCWERRQRRRRLR